jgi:XTP/dITP diphosphohydrolase
MKPVMSIVVATSNRAKLAETRALLGELPVEVLSASEALGEEPHVVEDGDSFEANALTRARAVASASMMVTIADDSGLEVEALGGRPGVRSSRFASEGATDAENNAELLTRMAELDNDQRKARFRCVIALIDPWDPDNERIVSGECSGSIAHKAAGTGGFGYDPLFVLEGSERTMAELSQAEKSEISHRGRALAQLQPELNRIVSRRLEQTMRILSTRPPR